LEVIHAIVTRPSRQGERLDVAGRHRCQVVLRELETRADIGGSSKSLAQSSQASMKED
jgi:hypothetical protein